MTTGSLATSGSHLRSYSLVYFGTGGEHFPSETSDFHSPKVSSSLRHQFERQRLAAGR